MQPTLTIGALAKRLGLRPSALRFYEQQGLLEPDHRSDSGYRLYTPKAEEQARFIQRAQRLGFSLAEIRALLAAGSAGQDEAALLQIAESRYLAIERQITSLLIQRHEMETFLREFGGSSPPRAILKQLIEQVCLAPLEPAPASKTLEWLLEHTGCQLQTDAGQAVLAALSGRHIHIWEADGGYHILVVGHDAAVEAALGELADIEARCHAHPAPSLEKTAQGYELAVQGENAFIFARLFLAFEERS